MEWVDSSGSQGRTLKDAAARGLALTDAGRPLEGSRTRIDSWEREVCDEEACVSTAGEGAAVVVIESGQR